ncbi:uracil-DNA glycosylase [Litchfieldia salsa]|uniref:uracil-DNA glycosylase n=1 Tax=Litchfieldia salsa TaxID=930152 RepID=UPI001EE42A9D|nr:uracil-DNA glycosylase [Litchfieldia salsa]
MKRINCFTCQHFYTTWEPQYPKGCKAFNFKTKSMPSLTVYQSSGNHCMKFSQKQAAKSK